MLNEIVRFLKQASRAHARRPAFSLLILLTLALGVGSAASIFSVVHALLLRPLPFAQPEQLAMLTSAQPERGLTRLGVSYPDFLDWQQLTDVFSEMAAVSNTRAVTLTGVDRPEHLAIELVSGNFFELLGVEAAEGRVFRPEDDLRPGGHPVAVLSHHLWQGRFGGDPQVVGREILLNGNSFTVLGVLPPFYRGTWWDRIDIWAPMMMTSVILDGSYLEDRKTHWHTVMARMRRGVEPEQAEEALNALAAELEKRYPLTNDGYRVDLFPLRELYYDYIDEDLWKALAASTFLLLLCCVNVASLLLTRGTVRQKEVAVRSALGASRRRLLLEQLGENLLLAGAGGLLGLLLAAALTRWLVAQSTIPTMNFDPHFMDLPVIAIVLAATIAAGLLVGLAPAVQALWSNLSRYLKDGMRSLGSTSFRRLLDTLAVIEVALALLLLIGAGLAVQRFFELRNPDLGIATDSLLTLRLDLSSDRYEQEGARQRFAERLVADAESLPAVAAAAFTGPMAPPDARMYTDAVFEDLLRAGSDSPGLRLYRQHVTPGYLRVMGIELLQGREFGEGDSEASPPVAIISRAVAESVWPEAAAKGLAAVVGKRLRRGLPDSTEYPWLEIVGVAETVKSRGPKDFGRGPDFDLYLPYLQDPVSTPTLMARLAPGAPVPAREMQRLVRGIDPDVPVYEVMSMRERLVQAASDERFLGLVMGIFAAIAALVTAVGVYGIQSYAVRQRTREIGVRIALGASRASLWRLVFRRGILQLTAGLVIGGLLAYGLKAKFSTSLDGDAIPSLMAAVGFLVAISLLAVVVPARRAARVTPIEALRYE